MKRSLISIMKHKLSIFLCMMLIAATACMTSGCNDKTTQESTTNAVTEQETSVTDSTNTTAEQETTSEDSASLTEQESTVESSTTESEESIILGEGETKFTLTVVDQEGTQTQYEIHTDKKTVGEALLDCDLVEGDNGEYGLYIKKVNGIEADYDKDGTYWAFYINDEYATTGVDSTDITEGASYSLKVEK